MRLALQPGPPGGGTSVIAALPEGPEKQGLVGTGRGGKQAECALKPPAQSKLPVLPANSHNKELRGSGNPLQRPQCLCGSKQEPVWGAWVAQWVKHPTSPQVMLSQSVSSSPAWGFVLTAQSLEPASDLSLPVSLCPSPAHTLSLSKMNKLYGVPGWLNWLSIQLQLRS